MSQSNLRVLVVGASIAGPTAAYWLAKSGAQVTVIERFPALRKGGQNIDIRTIGVEVMRRMPGMEEQVRANLYDIEGWSIVDTNGRSFGTMGRTGDPDQQSMISEFEIHRGQLSRILHDMTKDHPNIQYIFDEQVTAIHQQANGPATVEFMNQTPNAEYDLVVDCSGSTSRTRGIGLGCGARDHIIPINCWFAYFTMSKDFLNGSKVGTGYSAPGRFLTIGHHPSGKGSCGCCISVHDPEESARHREAQKKGIEATKEYVAQRFSNMGWLSNEVVEEMMASDDFYSSESMQVKVPNLYKGRFVLVGDAGYSPGPTGFGTSLALGGAYILAGEIAKHKGNLEAGLQAYEEKMRALLVDMQKIPPGVPGFMAPQTEFGIWVRNMVFAFIAWGIQFGSYFTWIPGMWASSLGKTKHLLEHYDFEQEKA